METKNTPSLPVVAVSNNDGSWHIAPSSAFKDGKRWYQDKTADDMTEANAAHIVRCVNAHSDLIAALTAIVSQVNKHSGSAYGFINDAATIEAFDVARALLEQAKP